MSVKYSQIVSMPPVIVLEYDIPTYDRKVMVGVFNAVDNNLPIAYMQLTGGYKPGEIKRVYPNINMSGIVWNGKSGDETVILLNGVNLSGKQEILQPSSLPYNGSYVPCF